MTKFKGLLFDFDGTLAKTMEDHFNAWKAVLAEYYIDLKPEDYYPLEGLSLSELAKSLCAKYNFTPLLPEIIVKKKDDYYLKNHKFELYPGVENLITKLKSSGILIGMVTTGRAERIKNSVPQDFLSKFNAITTAEDAPEGKQSAAPYLKGAEKLGLKPEECIAVENSPLGVKSAKSAGIYCIAVCNTLEKSHFAEADKVVSNFEELGKLDVIKKLAEK